MGGMGMLEEGRFFWKVWKLYWIRAKVFWPLFFRKLYASNFLLWNRRIWSSKFYFRPSSFDICYFVNRYHRKYDVILVFFHGFSIPSSGRNLFLENGLWMEKGTITTGLVPFEQKKDSGRKWRAKRDKDEREVLLIKNLGRLKLILHALSRYQSSCPFNRFESLDWSKALNERVESAVIYSSNEIMSTIFTDSN